MLYYTFYKFSICGGKNNTILQRIKYLKFVIVNMIPNKREIRYYKEILSGFHSNVLRNVKKISDMANTDAKRILFLSVSQIAKMK